MAESSNFEVPSAGSGSPEQRFPGLFSDPTMFQRPSMLDIARQQNQQQTDVPQVDFNNHNQADAKSLEANQAYSADTNSQNSAAQGSDYPPPDYRTQDDNRDYPDADANTEPDLQTQYGSYSERNNQIPGYPVPGRSVPGYPTPTYPLPGSGYGYGYGYGYPAPGYGYPNCPYPGGGFPPGGGWGIPQPTERVYRHPPYAPLPQQPRGELYDKTLPWDQRYHCNSPTAAYELRVLNAIDRMRECKISSNYLPVDPRLPRNPREPLMARDLPALFVKQIIGQVTGDRRTGSQAHLEELEPMFIARHYARLDSNLPSKLTGAYLAQHPQIMSNFRTGDVFLTFTPSGQPTNAFFYIAPYTHRAITPNGGWVPYPEAGWVDKTGVIHITPLNIGAPALIHVYRPSARQRY